MMPSLAKAIDAASKRDAAAEPFVFSATLHLSRRPPSVNALYRNVRGKGRVKTTAYKDWLEVAGQEIRLEQRVPLVRGTVRIAYALQRGVMKADLGNYLKALDDALVAFGVIEDDSLIEGYDRFEWADVEGVKIEVRSVSGITTRGRVAA